MCFKHHKRNSYTWLSPDGNTRNKIDYIAIHKRWFSSILDAKSYPGADGDSDHNLVLAKMRLKSPQDQEKGGNSATIWPEPSCRTRCENLFRCWNWKSVWIPSWTLGWKQYAQWKLGGNGGHLDTIGHRYNRKSQEVEDEALDKRSGNWYGSQKSEKQRRRVTIKNTIGRNEKFREWYAETKMPG